VSPAKKALPGSIAKNKGKLKEEKKDKKTKKKKKNKHQGQKTKKHSFVPKVCEVG